MSANEKQNKPSTSGAYSDAVVRAKNELTADQARKSKHDKKFILLILLLMFLAITQAIVLLSGTGVNESPEPVFVDERLENIKMVNDDLKAMKKSIDEFNAQPDPEATKPVEKIIEVEKSPAPVIVAPVAVKKEVQATKPDTITRVEKREPTDKKLTVVVPVVAISKQETQASEITVTAIEIASGYIKQDNEGNSLEDDTEQWTCVHDTATGLVWEVKSKDDAMRDSNNLYSWFKPGHTVMPGEPDGGRCMGDADCDTNAYVKAMNERNYCGHNDWQLPTREQMQTLVDLRNGNDKVKINKQYFPNTMPSWYWTSSDKENNNEFAWYVLFRNGFALSDLKERPKHIRLVRKNMDTNNGG